MKTLLLVLACSCTGMVSAAEGTATDPLASLPPVSMFAGDTGERCTWQRLFMAMDAADIIVIGESHTDADGHAIQLELLRAAVTRWPELTLSLEEFDRGQQPQLDAFASGELSGAELYEVRDFVNLKVKTHWSAWYLPKLTTARDAGVPLLASNSPLQYSRIVRNYGCDELPELTEAERALFDCPSVPIDPAYRDRFAKNFQRAVKGKAGDSMKAIGDEQLDKLFRAHRVWDATMAASIVNARSAGADKVIHLVGGFHSEFEAGLIQELRARDPQASILVISMTPRRSARFAKPDRGKGDIVVYTRTRQPASASAAPSAAPESTS